MRFERDEVAMLTIRWVMMVLLEKRGVVVVVAIAEREVGRLTIACELRLFFHFVRAFK